MKMKLFCFAIATTLAVPAFAVDDTASDGHTVAVTVAKVNIIDILGAAPTIGCVAPAQAGDALTCTPGGDNATYDITSNSQQGTSTGQTLSVKTDAVGAALGLTVASAATVGTSAGAVALAASDQPLVTAILNKRANGVALTYSITQATGAVVPHTNGAAASAVVTYTLSNT